MSWPHRVIIIVPADLRELANKIGRAMDPDSGGDATYGAPLSSDGISISHRGAAMWAAVTFVETVNGVLDGTLNLSQIVAEDYAKRWPDLTPPTAQECADFVNRSIIEIDRGWQEVLDENELQTVESDIA